MTNEEITIKLISAQKGIELLEEKIESLTLNNALMHGCSDEARILASLSIDRRLEGMNEFREQIGRERNSFLPKEMYEREHLAISTRVAALELANSSEHGRDLALESRTSQKRWMVGTLVTVISFTVALIIGVLRYAH